MPSAFDSAQTSVFHPRYGVSKFILLIELISIRDLADRLYRKPPYTNYHSPTSCPSHVASGSEYTTNTVTLHYSNIFLIHHNSPISTPTLLVLYGTRIVTGSRHSGWTATEDANPLTLISASYASILASRHSQSPEESQVSTSPVA